LLPLATAELLVIEMYSKNYGSLDCCISVIQASLVELSAFIQIESVTVLRH